MWYNPMMVWLLRSPVHGLISRNFMLVTVTGRTSGKAYTTPVNYSRDGDTFTVISLRDRTWWRNLCGDRPATIRLQGRDVPGLGTVVQDDAGVTSDLTAYLRKNPQLAKYFAVSLDADGQPMGNDVTLAARTRVVIHIKVGRNEKESAGRSK